MNFIVGLLILNAKSTRFLIISDTTVIGSNALFVSRLQDGAGTPSAGSATISSSRMTATRCLAVAAPAASAAGLPWALQNQGG